MSEVQGVMPEQPAQGEMPEQETSAEIEAQSSEKQDGLTIDEAKKLEEDDSE